MEHRRRFKQQTTLQDRISEWAVALRNQIKAMAPGPERDSLATKLRQAETAMHLDEWAGSPGLQPQNSAMNIKIRKRAPFPNPWKWEIYAGDKLVTASHESYYTQGEAWLFGQEELDNIRVESDRTAASYKVHDGVMVPIQNK